MTICTPPLVDVCVCAQNQGENCPSNWQQLEKDQFLINNQIFFDRPIIHLLENSPVGLGCCI